MGAKTAEQRAQAKRADYFRRIGKPLWILPEEMERARAHIQSLYERGMSYAQISATCPGDVAQETCIAKILKGQTETMHRDTFNAVMQSYWVPPVKWRSGRRIDPTGVRRRLRALVAEGFGYSTLGPIMGISYEAVHQLCRSERDAFASTLGMVVELYDKLECANPADYGASSLAISRAKGTARRYGWAPARCWDSDTIDDPAAFPEWTGACGTVTGYNIHRAQRIGVEVHKDYNGAERVSVLCPPCQKARAQEKSDHEQRLAERRGRATEMLLDGATYREVAAEVGMSTRTVQRIAKELKGHCGPEQYPEVDDAGADRFVPV